MTRESRERDSWQKRAIGRGVPSDTTITVDQSPSLCPGWIEPHFNGWPGLLVVRVAKRQEAAGRTSGHV
jgi:hypothetical protein